MKYRSSVIVNELTTVNPTFMKIFTLIATFILVVFYSSLGFAQRTVGTLLNDSNSFHGYTLFAPMNSNNTYLINNCGELIKTWESEYHPDLSVYLLENGDLLRTAANNGLSPLGDHGVGRIERYNWDGDLIWKFESNSNFNTHHDIEYLPNGNILAIAREIIKRDDVIAAGRNPNKLESFLYLEQIIEIEPTGEIGGNIVWEWHAWDHIIQDFDSTLSNYGSVSEHPEKININFPLKGPSSQKKEWLHFNGIDYNAELDQIIISVRNFSEVWIIDHSTTTMEAASSTGGKYGKGGDLLYRYGNPRTYQRGTGDDRKFFFQHDAHWIPKGLPNEGKIMVYNNGEKRPGGDASSIDIFVPPVDAQNNYILIDTNQFGPKDLFWSYMATPATDFYSGNISGAQQLPNGNILITEGEKGHLHKIDKNKKIVWSYVSPIGDSLPAKQGDIPFSNMIFKAHRYGYDDVRFPDTLFAKNVLEIDSLPSNCVLFPIVDTTSNISAKSIKEAIGTVFPNPFTQSITIETNALLQHWFITDINGKTLISGINSKLNFSISTEELCTGIYFIKIGNTAPQMILKL